MALRVLMMRRQLTDLQTELNSLRETEQGFEARERELETSIQEAKTAEERSAVESAVGSFETDRSNNTSEIERINGEIKDLETKIREAEKTSQATRKTPAGSGEERTEFMPTAENRNRFYGMTIEQRDAFLSRDDIKDFLSRVRGFRGEARAVTGKELGIPTIMFPILRDTSAKYSKLLKYVTVKSLKGKSRQNIAGTIPEGIWTEATGALNDLDIVFSQLEMDGFKVGGFIAIPNSILEDDDDLELTTTIIEALGQAIGLALDKAIVYGTGQKMPVGFITRLATQEQPTWWGENQGTFTDLHSSNILTLNIGSNNGVAFFQPLMQALAVADPRYATENEPVWIMNRKTHLDIKSRALAFNAAAILSNGMENKMPGIGGEIVELEFMPDFEIAGGFLSIERLAERSGMTIGSSDIPLYLQDQTVFKATQRYDGKPARGEAFVLVNYNNTDAKTSTVFGADYVNEDIGMLIVTTAPGTDTGETAVTVAGETDGATLKYKISGAPIAVNSGYTPKSWTEYTKDADIKAQTGSYITVIEVDKKGKAVKVGSGVVTSKE